MQRVSTVTTKSGWLLQSAATASLALHAIAGGLLLNQWQTRIEPSPAPRTLQVALLAPAATPVSPPVIEALPAPTVQSEPDPKVEQARTPAPPALQAEIQPEPETEPAPPHPTSIEKARPEPAPVARKKPAKPTLAVKKIARSKVKEKASEPIEFAAAPVAASALPAAQASTTEQALPAPREDDAIKLGSANSAPAADREMPEPLVVTAIANPSAAVTPVATPPHFDAEYLNNPKPLYPLPARRLKLEGTVVLRVMVKASGMPDAINLAQSSGSNLLDEAARAAVQSWRFTPARQGDLAIDHWVDVPVRFRLVDAGDR